MDAQEFMVIGHFTTDFPIQLLTVKSARRPSRFFLVQLSIW